jgi:NADPH:quinone reductase-like Zn-dependent oxidoreductase
MKAAIYKSYGDADVLELTEINEPKLGENEVLVKVKYISVNPIDWKVRKGLLKIVSGNKFPKLTGSDFSGIVEESNISDYKKGDEVYGYVNVSKKGSSAEYIVVTENNLQHKPIYLTLEEAGVVSLTGSTVVQSLITKAKLKKDMKVFVNGGTGGVGSFAIQLAKHYNCFVATSCSEKSIPYAKDFGADMIIDYTKDELFTNEKYDIIFDGVSNLEYLNVKKHLNSNGCLISLKPRPKNILIAFFNNLISKKKNHIVLATPTKENLKKLKELYEEGRFKPYIDKSFSFEQIQEAHKYNEAGHTKGKVLIKL